MRKGDGKQRREKRPDEIPSSSLLQSSDSASPLKPQRVTNDINVPVRYQIKMAQVKKEVERQIVSPTKNATYKRTAYRKSLDEEEEELAKVERQKRGSEPDWDVILNATAVSPLVIVDAYNIIHKWPRLKKWLEKGMLSKARSLLVHDLEELKAVKGWRIEVVFDGFGRVTSGPLADSKGGSPEAEKVSRSDQEASKKVTDHGVRIVFSGIGASADAYIESRCFEAKTITDGQITGNLIVASDDALIRCAAVNAGAVCMSAGRMIDELKALRKATLYRVEAAVAKANGHEVRPAQLHGTPMPNIFRNGAIIIETKRKKRSDSSHDNSSIDV